MRGRAGVAARARRRGGRLLLAHGRRGRRWTGSARHPGTALATSWDGGEDLPAQFAHDEEAREDGYSHDHPSAIGIPAAVPRGLGHLRTSTCELRLGKELSHGTHVAA